MLYWECKQYSVALGQEDVDFRLLKIDPNLEHLQWHYN